MYTSDVSTLHCHFYVRSGEVELVASQGSKFEDLFIYLKTKKADVTC